MARFDSAVSGNRDAVPTLEVQPRQTPEERADTLVAIDVDDALTVHAEVIEEWVAPRQSWEFTLREGHEFGRANNVEAQVLFASGEQTSSLTFRLDQLDAADDLAGELVLRFEEREGIAKTARLTANGLDVELFHILTFT
jgi:hypothetical protein